MPHMYPGAHASGLQLEYFFIIMHILMQLIYTLKPVLHFQQATNEPFDMHGYTPERLEISRKTRGIRVLMA